MEPRFETRPATLADLDAVLAHVQAGFDSYAAFAPAGWEPPAVPGDRATTASLLKGAETWALLGLAEGRPVGHVSFFPGRERHSDEHGHWSERAVIPGLAHLWQLFVLPEWWGRGVAPLLHDRAIAEMKARNFVRARLFTPSLHARARRFYERRGWFACGELWSDPLRLELTEYRLALRAP